MQTPATSDPSFKSFLEKIQDQNNRGFVTQLVQLKADRENVGKDNDKREEQLDQANENLKDLKDETSSTKNSLREGLHDVSDDIVELQDQLDTANDSLSEIATAVTGSKDSLDEAVLSLSNIKEALTGLKAAVENVGYDVGKDIDSGHLVATIGAIGANTTKLLDELVKELSLTRKLTEGSVEYSKEAAQYRNTSGRDVENKVSGKTSKDGGFIDFETARDTLSGQGERARKENKVFLTTGVTSTRSSIKPGDATASSLGADLGSLGPAGPEDKTSEAAPSRNTSIKRARRERGSVTGDVDPKKEEGEELDRSLLGRIKDSAKFFMTDGLSEKDSKEVVKKERETKVSSPRQENPEADNISSTGEIQADAAKSDLELSKQMLDTTREQLTVLKEIRDALAPKTPGELIQGGPKGKGTPEEKEEEGGGGGFDLTDLPGKGALKKAGSLGKSVLGKAATAGKAAMSFAGSGAGQALGAAAAIGVGAYTAYTGYTAAEDSKQAKMEEVQAKVDSGEMKPDEAAAARKEIGNTATVEKSEAVGEGTGMAAGGIAGMKAGAMIGTFLGGPVGAGVGAVAGGALGAFAGSKAGKVVGEYGGKAVNAAGSFFGGIGDKVKGAYGDAKTIYKDYNRGIGSDDQPLGTAMADMNMSVSKESDTRQISQSQGPGFNATTTTSPFNKGIVGEKSILGSTTLGGIFTAKGKQSGKFLGTSSDERIVEGKVEGRQINQTDNKYGNMLGKRISGGLFGKDTYSVTSEMSGTGGESAEYDLEVSKGQYNELKELNKKGDIEGARKKLAEIKAKSAENAEALNIASPEETVSGASPILKGKDVVQASTENKDMERDAKGRGGANNTVVSNNVSSNNTTKIVPMKANPRPEYTGSALDRYTSRIAVY